MTTIHVTVTTPVTPERIVRAFTDFTPRRLRTFPNIDQEAITHISHQTMTAIRQALAPPASLTL